MQENCAVEMRVVAATIGFAVYRTYLDMHDACGLDNSGSWAVGMAFGNSPYDLRFSDKPAVSCHNIKDTVAGFVSQPFMLPAPVDRPDAKWYVLP
jgi:hypothetical protein